MSSTLNTDIPIFAGRIKRARKEAGLYQHELAVEVGVSMRTVQNWEAGDSEPRGARMRSLSEVLGKRIAWFYEEEAA